MLVRIPTTLQFSWKGDCEEVTVGDCTINLDEIIQEVTIFKDVDDCQHYCHGLVDCVLFRFDGKSCTLLHNDYRKDCHVAGGPYYNSIDGCLEVDHQETCDLYKQEDCEYNAKVLLETPIGSVPDPKDCQDFCSSYHDLGCEYWSYNSLNKTCVLLEADGRNCQTWGGPRNPSLTDCTDQPVIRSTLLL